ncbi:hypothetical protein SO802_006095 [Lithocarpus litseifolius]|uniref:Uncharacterized protein n=1 Tax=Lithocarpus litseifolius TaxID=425828 RepID=A0AAW2DJY3_9ROSI
MSPRKKTTAKKAIKRQRFEEDRFRNRDAFEAFSEFYKDVVIIVEKEVDLPSFESTCILNVFRDRTWAPFLTSLVDVHHVLVQEFFLNAVVKGNHLNCWVRGKEFTLSAVSIQKFLQIRLVFLESSLPYDKSTSPVISAIAQVLGGDQYKKCLLTTSFSPEGLVSLRLASDEEGRLDLCSDNEKEQSTSPCS